MNNNDGGRTFTDYELGNILQGVNANERNVTRTVEAQRWFNLLLQNTTYELFAGTVTADKLREISFLITDKLNER